MTTANRLVRLPGTRNVRDLGGWPTVDGRHTRWRTLYRGDCLDHVDEAGQKWLIAAGLRTIIDLRGDAELLDHAHVFADSPRVTYRRLPFWTDPLPPDLDPDLTQGYRRELDLCGRRLSAIVDALLEPDALPAFIHCAAGKDRTGVVVGLLLDAVGVTRAATAQDYALSAECLGPDYVAECQAWIARDGRDWTRWAHTVETPPERMLRTLDYLDRQHGGVEAYLARHGLGHDRIALLRCLLVDAD